MVERKQAVVAAHKFSIRNREILEQSRLCGCFHCQKIFPPTELKPKHFEREAEGGETAFCPYCGIDSLIGDQSGYAVEPELLAAMKAYWFD
ncbi:hypothetical protein L4G92_00340 [Neisseria sp. ZJ106]|uniref:Cytoplasmic protein n=1 Tax=Neisseria lisongii TaxID=2912188 RepID=A0AAW5ALP8_9NEIS|nr:hypothetical protein [Neisseria lisongii]MCF7520506.1 hypothetical protein [Neisseria lisongii]MCF7530089.1 hypothetical protein [Neisseria lisongii]WCL71553.1 hypothetical protein PJU73_00020 [Neisseria lisongii]